MARTETQVAEPGSENAAHAAEPRQILAADSAPTLSLPGNDYVANAEMLRDGADLILRAPDGSEIVIQGYFTADPAPLITSPDGAALTPALVQSFAHDAGPVQYAAAESAADESPVGTIEDLNGQATVTRQDGTRETLSEGSPIFEGDVIETGPDGAVNIVFADETSFAVSRNAKLAIDQYVYDPHTESGETSFSVLRGLFVFTSGLVGRDDPDDVKIETPMGSIGIRGTIIAGDADSGTVTVVEGAIVLRSMSGQELTLADQFDTARFAPQGGTIEHAGVRSAEALSSDFGGLSGVLPTFFNALGGNAPGVPDANTPDAGAPQDAPPSDAVDGKPAQDGGDGAALAPGAQPPAPDPVPPPVLPGAPMPQFLQGMDFIPVFMPPPLPGDLLMQPPMPMAPPPAGLMPPPGTVPPTQTANEPPPGSASPGPGGTGAPLPPPLVIELKAGPIPDDLAAGDVVASVKTSFPFASVLFTLATNGPFQIVPIGPDRAIVVYTGSSALVDGTNYGFSIVAQLPDGRQATRFYTETVVEPFQNELDIGDAGASGVHLVGSGSGAGVAVARIGDTDGDGLREIGFVDQNGATGQVQIREWTGSGFATLTNPATGVGGPTPDIYENMSFAGLGDVNGDGKADYAVGSPASDPASAPYAGDFTIFSGINPGSSQVVLDSGSPSVTGSENYGHQIRGAGDVNNDGFADILVSAPYEDGASSITGVAWLLFGNANFFSGGSIDPANIGSTVPGLIVSGVSSTDRFGESVAAIGDFNDDGLNDFIVGAPGVGGKGEAYILFGQDGNAWSGYNLSTAGNYLKITGTGLGAGSDLGGGVMGLGDLNGDGKSDVLVAATEETSGGDGKAYVIYGGAGGSVDVSTLNGSNGFAIDGTNSDGLSLLSGGSVGDFNGDGRSDFALVFGDGAGLNDIYVVYGRAGMAATLTLDDLEDPAVAFHMVWDGHSGESIEIAAAGDINGDGRDDFLIGSDQADLGNGEVYLIEGRDAPGAPPTLDLTAPGNLLATAGGQSLIGSTGADVLGNAGFGNLSIRAGAGNDMLNASGGGLRVVDGGSGNDTLSLVNNSLVLDFSRSGSSQIAEIERLRFLGTGQTLKLGIEDVFQLMHESADGKLRIFNETGANSNTLQIDSNDANSGSLSTALTALGFSSGGTVTEGAVTYNVYTFGTQSLLVDQSISSASVL